ncbi:MAG: bacillithiol biosynthesis deacetylase BshB1 [Gemmatimonadales bacterium]
MSQTVDLLAVAAHPDDAELTCGGTLIKAARDGHRTGILDLTRGEMGTRGSPETRDREATQAAEIMGVTRRVNAGLPDAHLSNSTTARKAVVSHLRKFEPRVVILPFPVGRHPDHRVASELVRDACFLAGLANYPGEGKAHHTEKIIYTMAYREDPIKPTFVVDISREFETKMEAIKCYASQFADAQSAGELFPTGQPLLELIRTQAAHYGSLIRVAYGEPFATHETVQIHNVVTMGVRSI